MNNIKYDKVYYPVREIRDIKDMIGQSAEIFGEKAAYLQKDKPGGTFCPISYRRFKDEMDALGTKFLDMGLKGEKIGVIGETCYQWILTYFATVCGVGVIVPLDKNLPPEELRSLVKRSGISAIVYTKRYEKRMEDLYNNPETIKYFIVIGEEDDRKGIYSFSGLINDGQKLLREGIREYVDADIDPEQFSTLMFTSGTTGLAKGVMLSHKNIVNNVYQMSKLVRIPEGGIVLSILPVHHAYEFTCSICTTFYQGKTIAICEGIKYIQKNMNEVKANIMLGVPLVFEKMYKGMWKQAERRGEAEKLRKAIDLSRKMKLYNNPRLMKKLFKAIHQSFGNNITLFIAGGAAIDPKVIEDFEAMGLPMIQGYGMSEHSPIIAVNQDRYSNPASVGKPMPGVEVKILDPDEYGVGEVICRSDSVMMGYYDNQEATDEVLIDGWLHTGDLGYFDEKGFLYLSGRKKTVIVTKGGKNIYPEEVEAVLMENELIQEVLVHGRVDERVGNVMVTADIFPNYPKLKELHGEMSGSEIYHFFKDLVDEINEKMPPYKAVKRINIREKEFVKTTTGKIKRYGNLTESGSGTDGNIDGDNNLQRAKMFMRAVKESEDPYVKYKNNRPVTDIKHMLETDIELYGDRPAFWGREEGEELYSPVTYNEVYSDVNGLGTALINRISRESRVAVIGDNSYKWVASFLAVINGAGVAVPLSKDLPDEEIKKFIADGEVSCVFFDEKYEELFLGMKSEKDSGLDLLVSFGDETSEDVISWNTLKNEGKKQIGSGDRQFIDLAVDADKMSVLLYASDIKGITKGVMLSHKNLAANLMAMASMVEITQEDVFLSILPAHFIYEITCGLLLPLYKGASVAFSMGTKYMIREMEEIQPTAIAGVPSLAEIFYKKIWQKAQSEGKEKKLQSFLEINHSTKRIGIDFSHAALRDILLNLGSDMKIILAGGERLDTEVIRFFNDIGVVMVQGYGISECAPMIAVNPDTVKDMKFESVGHVLPGMEAEIADESESGIGEIRVKGLNVMLGYYKDPAATEEVLKDGWLNTGAIGFIDDNDFIYITGTENEKPAENA